MIHFSRRAALFLMLLFAGVTISLPTGAGAQNAARSTPLAGLVRFTLPTGETVTGQVLGFDGQMYSVQLRDGAMLVRKDFLVGLAPARAARPARRTRFARRASTLFPQ